ncbi:MAG: GNAT family N-acetyltransferase [Opitutus sp.]
MLDPNCALETDMAIDVPAPVIRIVSPLDRPDWDAQVATLPATSFFHGQAWAKVLNATYGYVPSYFIAESGSALLGVLPFMEVDSWLTGRRGVGLPFTDECAMLANDARTSSALLAALRTHASHRKWKYAECRGAMLGINEVASSAFWAHSLELHEDEAAQLSLVTKSAKGVIKKLGQSALQVEVSQSLQALREFHGLLCKTRKRHGVPPQPFSFFENIYRHILAANQGCVVLAKSGGVPAAGAVYLHSGKSAVYKYAASDEAFKHLSANSLVMWKGIRWHAEKGFKTLNFGRSALTNEGLRKFKLSWGPSEYRLDYFRHDTELQKFVLAPDEGSAWQSRVFNALPTNISRALGAFLYKHAA